jgi:hypothetical protein
VRCLHGPAFIRKDGYLRCMHDPEFESIAEARQALDDLNVPAILINDLLEASQRAAVELIDEYDVGCEVSI